MTETQALLIPYVTARINEIITAKESVRTVPASANKIEILNSIHTDLTTVFSHLYQEGIFEGHHGINHSFFTRIKDDNYNRPSTIQKQQL